MAKRINLKQIAKKPVMREREETLKVLPAACEPLGPFAIVPPPPGCAGATGRQSLVNVATGEVREAFFGVPLGDDEEDIAVRVHEYSHLALEREYPEIQQLLKLVPELWSQVGCDNIVNEFARKRSDNGDIVKALPGDEKVFADEKGEQYPRHIHAVNYLQALGNGPFVSRANVKHDPTLTSGDTRVLIMGSKKLREIGAQIAAKVGVHNDKLVKDAANVLLALMAYFDPYSGTGKPGGEGGEKGNIPIMDNDPDMFEENAGWEKPHIVPGKLDRNVHSKRLCKRPVPCMMGALRNPIRTLTPMFDGRAFQVRPRKEGGSIMLDMSGSMALTNEDITRLLTIAPMASIYGYSDDEIFVLAEKGKYVSKLPNPDGANGCDGPALELLAKMPGPRFWISDGQVFGKAGCNAVQLSIECNQICNRNDILRVQNLETFYNLLGLKVQS